MDTWGWGSSDRLLSADLVTCVKQNVAIFFLQGISLKWLHRWIVAISEWSLDDVLRAPIYTDYGKVSGCTKGHEQAETHNSYFEIFFSLC